MFRPRRRTQSRATAESHITHGWDALEDEDPEAAEEEAREALKLAPESNEALEVLGASLVDQERYDEALPILRTALRGSPDDASILLDFAIALVGVYRIRAGVRYLRRLVARDPEDADAHYWLAVACELLGEDDSAAAAYARAAELDPDCNTPPSRVSREEFESLLSAAIEELPLELRRHLGQEVTLTVTDFPSRSLARAEDPPISPLILGLFVGLSLAERSIFDVPSLPPMILIFQKNIERIAKTREEFIEELRITLMHELGHYLGLDEEDLHERGLE
jgi:predicted Zn-dependent protease with MMP-like domain